MHFSPVLPRAENIDATKYEDSKKLLLQEAVWHIMLPKKCSLRSFIESVCEESPGSYMLFYYLTLTSTRE